MDRWISFTRSRTKAGSKPYPPVSLFYADLQPPSSLSVPKLQNSRTPPAPFTPCAATCCCPAARFPPAPAVSPQTVAPAADCSNSEVGDWEEVRGACVGPALLISISFLLMRSCCCVAVVAYDAACYCQAAICCCRCSCLFAVAVLLATSLTMCGW